MEKTNLRQVAEVEQRSPTGKFHSLSLNVSRALGGLRNTGASGGGHPFDFQVRRIPRGAAICPHHAHLAQAVGTLRHSPRLGHRAQRTSAPRHRTG